MSDDVWLKTVYTPGLLLTNNEISVSNRFRQGFENSSKSLYIQHDNHIGCQNGDTTIFKEHFPPLAYGK